MLRTILIIGPNATEREALAAILRGEYLCRETGDAASALEAIRQDGAVFSAVLLDMAAGAEADGAAFLAALREDEPLRSVPVVVMAEDEVAQDAAFSRGAVACLQKPCQPDRLAAVLGNVLRLCEAAAGAVQRDTLTGLLNRSAFFAEAEQLTRKQQPGYYVLSCLNIDSFKVINEQYGEEKGDEVLRHVGRCFYDCVTAMGGICCRHSADQFAVLYPALNMNAPVMLECHRKAESPTCINRPIRIRIGRCIVEDAALSIGSIYNRAVMAEESIRGRYDVRIALYQDSMREQLLHEQKIVSEMQSALHGGQFETWFQPQYNHATGALIGAEALVRWRHPEDGLLIPPGKFIPAFERNGFIYELDRYIWEQVCVLLRRWLDEGRNPLPISVNVSRKDILTEGFVDVLTGLVEKYRLPADLLRLEITESAFAQSSDPIVSAIKKLVAFGFTVEIDDFGSGYSSLNTLKDVPAHIIKLDMRFLETSEDSQRGGNILESVVRMAKWLNMTVIAEGVETKEQADYLKSIGCFYIQGYLYAKPMPLAEYERLEQVGKKERRLESLRTVKHLSTNAFWDPQSMDTLIFNTFLGAACILEVYSGRIEVLRANDKYVKVIGSAGMTLTDALRLDWAAYMDAESRRRYFATLQDSAKTGSETDGEYLFLNLPNCDEKTYLRVTLRVIATSGLRYLVYCLIENTTGLRAAQEKERSAEQKRQAAAQQLQVIMDNVSESVTASSIEDGIPRLMFANEQFYRITGYTKEQYAAEIANAFNLVHPEDRAHVEEAVGLSGKTHQALAFSYRLIRRDQSVRWIRGNISMIRIPGVDEAVQLGVARDVTEQRQAERREHEAMLQMQAIMDNVNGGVSAVTFEDGAPRYIFANNEHFAMLGYTKEQFEQELPRGLEDIIHPDDYPAVMEAVEQAATHGHSARVEYRVRRRDGREIWVHGSGSVCSIEGIDAPVHIIVSIDVTEQKETVEQFRFLNDMAHDILAQPDIDAGIDRMLRRLLRFFGSQRAYIVEYDAERRVASNTYEVCAEGVASEVDSLQDIPFYVFSAWKQVFDARDFVDIPDVGALPEESAERRILRALGVRSAVAVALRRNGASIGFIGLDDTCRNHEYIGRLVALGDYISVMLMRRDYEAKLTRQTRAQEQMMLDMPGGYATLCVTQAGVFPVFVNEELCRLCGISREEAMRKYAADALAALHPDDVEPVTLELARALANKGTGSMRLRMVYGGGGYVRMQLFYRMTEGADGQVYINGYFTDATERNRAEEQRRELLDNLAVGAGLYAYDGRELSVVHINKRYWQLVGRNPRAQLGRAYMDTVHPVDQPKLTQEFQAAIQQGRDFDCDIRIRYGKDRFRTFHVEGKIDRQPDGTYLIYTTFTPVSGETTAYREMLPGAVSAIMSISPDYTYVKDKDLRYVCASLSTAKLLGFESEEALVGKTNYELMDRARADRFAAYDRGALQSGEPYIGLEESLSATQGAERWSAVSKYPLRDAEGKIIGLLGIGRDVTELYDAAFELETLLNVIPSGVFKYSADEQTEFAYISLSLMKRLGYSEQQFRSKFHNRFRQMVYEEDRARVEDEILTQESTGGIGKLDYRIEAADGRLRWFHNEGTRVTDQNGKTWHYATIVDITSLRETEAKLRLLTDGVSGGLGTFEYRRGKLRALYINDGFFRFLGYSREEYMKMCSDDYLATVYEEDRANVWLAFHALLRGTGRDESCTFRCRTKDGGCRWFSLGASLAERHSDSAIFNVALYDVTEQKRVEQKLRLSEEEYRLATLHSNVSIGRYSIAKRSISLAPATAAKYGYPEVMENIPYSLVEQGDVSDDTAQAYVSFYERIMRGEKEGRTRYQRKLNGEWTWVETHFSTLYASDGKPVSAIVSFRDISDQIEREAIYKKWMQSLQDRPETSYTLFRCNLSKNASFQAVEGALLRPAHPVPDSASYTERLQRFVGNHVQQEDRERFVAAFSSEALHAGYRAGKHTAMLEFREPLPEGGERWLRATIELVEYPESTDIVAYMLFEDIDAQKREEMQTQALATTDPLTGLLNRSTFQEQMEACAAQRGEGLLCALFMLDLDGFKQINDTFGHVAGDRTLVEIGQKLRSVLRKGDLICRIGGDEFMVFLCDLPDRDAIEKKAGQLCALLQKPLSGREPMSVSIGIACLPDDGADFEVLYRKADLALYHVKVTGKNHFAFYDPRLETASDISSN